jgi:tetratricopeptide (TPR) repeat protein
MKVKTLWLTVVALACLTVSAFAQVGRIEGDVLKKGTTEPIVGAEVDIIRTDIKGNYPVKTDKKGHFLHAGVPYVGTYTVLISAPGQEPTFLNGIRPDREMPLKIELNPGDGRKITMEDLKRFQSGGGAAAASGGAAAAKQPSAAEIKKQQEEYAKAKEANEKAKGEHEAMKKVFESGVAKSNNKDYAGAIADFSEAAKLDAEQYAVWANLSLALYNRGVTNLNESIKGDLSKRDAAKQDFTDAANATDKALALVEKEMADPAKAADAKKRKATTLKIKADAQGLMAKRVGVMEMVDPAVKAYQETADLSELPADKIKFQLAAAEVYFESGKAEEAVAAYTKIIEANPDNIDAMYKLGLAYASVAKFQESANTFQKFLDTAPGTDPRVPEVKVVLKDLVVGNNLQPPKSEPAKRATPPKRKP